MNNVGITGASGFLGRNLINHLQHSSYKLIPFEGDLLIQKDLENYIKNHKIDQLVHLAGTFSLPFQNLIDKNLLTTENLLVQVTKAGVKKIIFASSGAVYGEKLAKESYESDSLNPNTLYGLTKMYAEDCLKYYHHNNNLNYIILRFPNIYGPGNNKGVIFNFMEGIKKNKKITVYGKGNQMRDFLYVTDACIAIEKALNYNKSEVFNISSPLRLSVSDIIQHLKKKYAFEIEYKEKENNLESVTLNIDKARKELGFAPKIVSLQIS